MRAEHIDEILEAWAVSFKNALLAEKWITKDGRAVFLPGMGETPPDMGEVAYSPEEHEGAAEAHRQAALAMHASGEHATALKHEAAMKAHLRAAAAVRAANEASKDADAGADPTYTSVAHE